jgi:hypothetical protein
MKLEITEKRCFNITELTKSELMAILTIVLTANESCFKESDKQKYGVYYSNEVLSCPLSNRERKALSKFCKSLKKTIKKW